MGCVLLLFIGQIANDRTTSQALVEPSGVSSDITQEQQRVIMEDRWLSVSEIARYLGIKRDTVYKWIDRRSMPSHKVGRLWKFRQEEVDAWVRSGGGAGRGHDTMSEDSRALLSP
jgi:excisionase family DNA binding protein